MGGSNDGRSRMDLRHECRVMDRLIIGRFLRLRGSSSSRGGTLGGSGSGGGGVESTVPRSPQGDLAYKWRDTTTTTTVVVRHGGCRSFRFTGVRVRSSTTKSKDDIYIYMIIHTVS